MEIGLTEQELRTRLEEELELAMRTERDLSAHAIAHAVARVLVEDHLRIAEQLGAAGIATEA